MSESTSNAGRRLAVYAINEREGDRAYWHKIGAAFTNRDGSLTLYLDALPLGTNKLQVREPREEGRATGAGAQPAGGAPGATPPAIAAAAGGHRRPAPEEVRP